MENFRQKQAKGEEGNTEPLPPKKQVSRKTFYCFTVFISVDGMKTLINRQLEQICTKFMYGEEICPTTKRVHLQGFMQLKKAMRITELSIAGNPHFEACKGSEEQNEKYCSKDGKVFKYGYPKPLKCITELRPWQKDIETIALTEPDDRKIYWFWEKSGNIGKSAFCKYMLIHHKSLLCQGGKHSDIMNLVFNTDMDTCNAVIFDIPRVNEGAVSYSALENIKNGMVCNTKYETGVKIFNPPHIFCFANFPPDKPHLLSEDRWIIKEL